MVDWITEPDEGKTLFDVAMMVDAFGDGGKVPSPLPAHFKKEVSLSPDVSISPMDGILRDLLEACEPRGLDWEPPAKSFGVNYAFFRRDAPDPYFSFDPDRRLWQSVQLSRLVHPTSVGFAKAGRLTLDSDGKVKRFAPSRLHGVGGRYFVAQPEKNWLSDEHIPFVRELLEGFDPDSLPERVLQALWQHEFLHQLYFVDTRWPLAASGLEAFIHTDPYQSTKQFVQRLLGVQEDLDIELADEETLYRLYDRRSAVAHGKRLGDLDEETRADYVSLEDLLREVLRAAILDSDFASIFEDPHEIRSRWPIS